MSGPGAIGLFGGTFDPVHFGHLRAASEVRELLGVDDFRLVPAGQPALREATQAKPLQRLEMLRLAVQEHPDLAVDDREIRREGRSYMVDTLGEIRAEAGDQPVILAVGQDAANELDRWHSWRQLFELAHLVVMTRPQAAHVYRPALRDEFEKRVVDGNRELGEQPAGLVRYLRVTQLAISSSSIRAAIAAGSSPRFLLPDRVLEYILRNGLYSGREG